MNLKTLTGPSIHAVLKEARRMFGDDVVLLESVPPQGNQPARITVMTDHPLPDPSAGRAARPVPRRRTASVEPHAEPFEPELVPAGDLAEPYPAASAQSGKAPVRRKPVLGYGYHAAPALTEREEATPAEEGFSPRRRAPVRAPATETPEPPRQAARNRLFPASGPPAFPGQPARQQLETLVTTQLDKLESHYARLERRLSETILSATREWVTHPYYGLLYGQGLHTRTLTRLFQSLSDQGFDPNDESPRLKRAMAETLEKCVDVSHQKVATGTQLFVGPSGAGKTALLLKLAKHPRFFGRRSTGVIIIRPEDEDALPYQCPVELYRRFDLPVQTVQRPEEMQQALHRVRKFSHVFIDTPPMPVRPAAARRFLAHLHTMTHDITPLQIHLVLNAAGRLDTFDRDFLDQFPLRPDTVALTHLDETPTLGPVLECLMALGLPVQFATNGPKVPNSVAGFSVSQLVDALLQAPDAFQHHAWDLS